MLKYRAFYPVTLANIFVSMKSSFIMFKWLFFALILLLTLSIGNSALAQDVKQDTEKQTSPSTVEETNQSNPKLTGRIVDMAGLLDSQTKAQLTAKLAALEQQTGDQIVIVTVTSLNGYDIETYANTLFRRFALGQKQMNNGVLFLIAPNQRRVRIEVGYGLEGELTDAASSTIINTLILPNFRDGQYQTGIIEGSNAIIDIITGNQADFEARVAAKKAAEVKLQKARERGEFIVNIIIFGFLIVFVGLPLFASIFGTKVGTNKYRWLGVVFTLWFAGFLSGGGGRGGFGGGGFGGGGFGGGGFGGGGGSSGGGGASGSW